MARGKPEKGCDNCKPRTRKTTPYGRKKIREECKVCESGAVTGSSNKTARQEAKKEIEHLRG